MNQVLCRAMIRSIVAPALVTLLLAGAMPALAAGASANGKSAPETKQSKPLPDNDDDGDDGDDEVTVPLSKNTDVKLKVAPKSEDPFGQAKTFGKPVMTFGTERLPHLHLQRIPKGFDSGARFGLSIDIP